MLPRSNERAALARELDRDVRPHGLSRCASHGLLLDDAATCTRCVREAGAQDGRRTLARLRMAKAWMNEHSVAQEERRVDTDEGARRELAGLGKGVVVPAFVVDNDQVLTGFDVRGVRLSEALAAHGIGR